MAERNNTASNKNSASEPKVLLVDDNTTNLQLLHETLDGLGYKLLIAKNGPTALRIAQKADPSLILLPATASPAEIVTPTTRTARAIKPPVRLSAIQLPILVSSVFRNQSQGLANTVFVINDDGAQHFFIIFFPKINHWSFKFQIFN